MFYLDVSKVNLSVVNFAIAMHAYFKCFTCFRRLLQMFHLYIAKVDVMLRMLLWLYMHVSNACFIGFRLMLQVFHLDVSKEDFRGAHVVMVTVVGGQRLAAAACYCWCVIVGHRVACLCCYYVQCERGKRSRFGVVPVHAWAWANELRTLGQALEFRTDRRGLQSGIDVE
jgi:hypothetical protein